MARPVDLADRPGRSVDIPALHASRLRGLMSPRTKCAPRGDVDFSSACSRPQALSSPELLRSEGLGGGGARADFGALPCTFFQSVEWYRLYCIPSEDYLKYSLLTKF